MDAGNPIKAWIYRNRRYAKQLLGAASRVLPAPVSRRLRALAEQVAFRVVPEYQGDTLPPIFHYWSSRHVRPLAERLGMTSAEEMYWSKRGRWRSARGMFHREHRFGCRLARVVAARETARGRPGCANGVHRLQCGADAQGGGGGEVRGLGDRLSVAVLSTATGHSRSMAWTC